MGGVMSPRVVLGAPPSPLPPLPSELGGFPIWSELAECQVGGCDAWEFRHATAGRCVVLQSVADTGDGRHVWIAWVPADARAGVNPTFAALAPALVASGLVSAWWECDEIDGVLRPRLDGSADADAVRVVWPWADEEELLYIGEVIA